MQFLHRIVNQSTDIVKRLAFGAAILNVAAAAQTPDVVAQIRAAFPEVPIIASGGNSNDSIHKTIQAGANAITYTPPGTAELFKSTMAKYREL